MNKKVTCILSLSSLLIAAPFYETAATRGVETIARRFVNLMQVIRSTSGNGLTEIPSSLLRDHGARFTYEFEEIVEPAAQRVGLARLLRELPHSNTDRMIRDTKAEWDSCLKASPPDIREQAKHANIKIKKAFKEYEEMLEDGSSKK